MQTSARSLAHELGRRLGRDARDLAALHDDVRRTLPRRSDVDAAWLYLAQAFALLCVVDAARREWAEVQREIDALEAAETQKRRRVREIQSSAPEFAAYFASGCNSMPLNPQRRLRRLHSALDLPEGTERLAALLAELPNADGTDTLSSRDFHHPPPARRPGRHDKSGLRDAVVQALLAFHPLRRGGRRWEVALHLAGYPRDVNVEQVRRDMRRRGAVGRPSSERDYLMAQWPRLFEELMASVGYRAVV